MTYEVDLKQCISTLIIGWLQCVFKYRWFYLAMTQKLKVTNVTYERAANKAIYCAILKSQYHSIQRLLLITKPFARVGNETVC